MKPGNNEILIRRSRGNLRTDPLDLFGWIGGKWYLTDHRIFFEPNMFAMKKQGISIPIENIISIEVKYPDFFSSKFVFFLNNESFIELHVPKRKSWIDDIAAALRNRREDEWDIQEIINTKKIEKPPGAFYRASIQMLILATFAGAIALLMRSLLKDWPK